MKHHMILKSGAYFPTPDSLYIPILKSLRFEVINYQPSFPFIPAIGTYFNGHSLSTPPIISKVML